MEKIGQLENQSQYSIIQTGVPERGSREKREEKGNIIVKYYQYQRNNVREFPRTEGHQFPN